MSKKKKTFGKNLSAMQIILTGYLLIILVGALLLTLPIASKARIWSPIEDCLFTATSATCVTGLIQYDTYTHWSLFGQIVIITLIQIGGVGFMTVAINILAFTKRKIGLSQRSLMQNSISAPQIGGIVRMSKFIIGGTFLVEGIGALLLCMYFIPRFGWGRGIYYSVFHSISAFCNAGFDLLGGVSGEMSSLVSVADNWYVNLVIIALIYIGGLGFFVWHDLLDKKFQWKRLNLQSKMVLFITTILLFLGTVMFALLEWNGALFEGMDGNQKILVSFFQSMTARTAGFATVDLARLSEASKFVMICLMLIGGATGSTAGGMKTTTFGVLCISIFTTFRRKKNVEAFGRRMDDEITRLASCVFMTYLLVICFSAVVVSAVESVPIITALFETVSAMATVGLSFGLTPNVCLFTKLLLTVLMICGRVGSITVLLAFSAERRVVASRLPLEQVQVG